MKYWERLFSPTILRRGREYYQAHRVQNLTDHGAGRYTAAVRGTWSYDVSVQISSRSDIRMKCSCPYAAAWSANCKHMAAVMFAVDELTGEAEPAAPAVPKRAVPAAEPAVPLIAPFAEKRIHGQAHYFDITALAGGLRMEEAEYRRACDLLMKEQYKKPVRTSFGYSSLAEDEGCLGSITAVFTENGLPCECSFRFSSARILEGSCACLARNLPGYFDPGQKLCRHQAATLLLLEDYIERNDPGDATDLSAARLLQAFRSSGEPAPAAEPADREPVRLEPKLIGDDESLRLSFRVGTGRLYIVRRLPELVNAVESGGKYPLGKTGEIDFGGAAFDEAGAGWYALIRRYTEDERRRAELEADGPAAADAPEVGQFIPLYGSLLDEFYDLAADTEVDFRDERVFGAPVETKCLLRDADPAVDLTVRQDGEGSAFRGVKVSGSVPKLFDGASHRYHLHDDTLSRISPGFLKKLQPLRSLGEGDVAFRVGRKNLSEFYYSLLPQLRDFAHVEEPDAESIAAYLPPEPAFAFWLDAVDGRPRCRAEAVYGERSFSLLDWDTGRPIDQLVRSVQGEQHVRQELTRFFPEPHPQSDEYLCPAEEKNVYAAITEGVEALMSFGQVHSTARFDALRVKRRVKVAVGVSLGSSLLDLSVSSPDIPQEELMEILASYRQNKTYHRLKSGEFVAVDDTIAELSEMMDAMHLTPRELMEGRAHIPACRALYLDKMLEQSESLDAVRDRRFRMAAKDFRSVNDADFEVPESLRGILRSYQAFGHKWLRTLAAYQFSGILADDMGLGKTLQVISVLLAEKLEHGGTSLVVTPASLVYNWQEEIGKFAPELRVCPVAGSADERQALIRSYQEYDVLVTSYDLLKRDIACYEDCEFLYEIVDEAQYIKNHTTAAAKAVKVIRSRHRIAMSGTPIENRLSELWSIFDFLMPGFLYGYDTFRKEWETPIVKKNDQKTAERLSRMVSPFILRRLKTDVLKDLPEKLEETRPTPLGEEQRRLYDAQVQRIREDLGKQSDDSFARGKIQILAELTRLRQLCCDPSLLVEGYTGASAKREACLELIESAVEGEHRVLLFSQFTSMLALLKQDLAERQIECFEITGDTPKADRLELVRRFNEGSVPVFLISLKAGGTGLNLTGADVVIHYDPWWNVAAQNQATDRTHRIGQTKVVTVYKLIAKDTVEERIQQLQTAKQALADAVLGGEAVNIADMTREELLELLR